MISLKMLGGEDRVEAMDNSGPLGSGYEKKRAQTKSLGSIFFIKFFIKNSLFRITCAAVASIFLWNQIAWAGDFITAAIDRLDDRQSRTFCPSYLQQRTSSQQSAVETRQEIEQAASLYNTNTQIEPPEQEKLDLVGPLAGGVYESVLNVNNQGGEGIVITPTVDGAIMSVTTQDGDVIHYIGKDIDYLERRDGSVWRNLRFGADGSLLDARITRADGLVLVVLDGVLKEAHSLNGMVFTYGADGLVASVRYPDGVTAAYTYIRDPATGEAAGTVITDAEKTLRYDAAGKLTRAEFASGRIAEYASGVITRIVDTDGREYIYEASAASDGGDTVYKAQLKSIIDGSVTWQLNDNSIGRIIYANMSLSDFRLDSSGNVLDGTVTYTDGSKVYIENGRIRKIVSSAGIATRYVYSGESVQQAINLAACGDTVYLSAGTYREHIVLSNGVNLVGEDSAVTTIHGDYQVRSDVIRACGNNRIENITISGSGPYASAPSSAVKIDGSNVKIRNNRIVDNQDYGLHISSGSNILIEKNFFKDNNLGVQLPNSGTTIQYNTFVNNSIAINVLNGPATVIRNNIITGSTFQSIYEFSWAAYSSGLPASGYAVVEGNILYGNRERGGYYCKCLPPAVISQTLGNLVSNPGFVNPAAGNYSIPVSSPAYGRGAFLPQDLSDSLDAAAGPALKPAIDNVTETGLTVPITLPGPMFDASGRVNPSYGFTDIPYYDTVIYDALGNVRQVRKPDGTSIPYMGGVATPAVAGWNLGMDNPGNLPYPAVTQADITLMMAEYDTLSKLGLLKADYTTYTGDGGYIISNLWPSGNRKTDAYIGSGLEWNGTVEYYDSPALKEHIVRLANMNPGEKGNPVYKEYDASGVLTRMSFDETGLGIEEYPAAVYVSGDYAVADSATGDKMTFKRYGNIFLIDSLVSADGTLRYWYYTVTGELNGHCRVDTDGTVRIYDSRNMLAALKEPEQEFIKGSNLPWINYGYDIGSEPGTAYHIGLSTAQSRAQLYEKLGQRRGQTVRMFLFCDFRSGMTFNASGAPTGFTDKVYDDMRTLLAAAAAFGVKLIPVLFDYGIADGKNTENGFQIGEHPALIADQAKADLLLGIFDAFFAEFAGDPSIYAWDVMNEPEFASAVGIPQLRTFVQRFVNLIHSKSPSSLVTVGSRNRSDMAANWTGLGLDFYQFHYYDNAESSYPLDTPASGLGLDRPVMAGELEPTNITWKLDTLYSNEYSGGLFWEDGYYDMSQEEWDLFEDWFNGTITTYTYYSSGRKDTETLSDGAVRYYEDAAVYDDGNGRLLREVFPVGAYKLFTYYDGTAKLRSIQFLLPGGGLFMKEEYDSAGEFFTSTEYYEDGSPRTVRMYDDTWITYDEEGALLCRGETINGIDITYNSAGRIVKIKDEEYEEDRRYVIVDGAVEFTLALNGNVVLAIRQGYYGGTDLISRQAGAGTPADLSVTYDNDITLGYTNDEISSISVAGGYVNFYNGDDIEYQNSASGALYHFTDGYLDRVATPEGNIYNFRKTAGAGGKITVEFFDAIIDGRRVSSLDPAIEDLIDGEIPNIRFVYDSSNNIEEVETSKYCRILFSNGRVSRTITPGGAQVGYRYITDQASGEITGLEMTEDGVLRTFDAFGKLVSIAFDDGNGNWSTLEYDDEKLKQIETSDGLLNSIEFDERGQLEQARLVNPEGMEYFFVGGTLQSFLDSLNAEYTLDSLTGRISGVKCLDTQETFRVDYDVERPDGKKVITFTSNTTGTGYVFEDGLLNRVADPSGMTVSFVYQACGSGFRTHRIHVSYANRTNTTYTYAYETSQTTVTDDLGNVRTFDQNKKILKLKTPYGETYDYVYDVNAANEPITIVNYSKKDKGGGLAIEYFKGQIMKITRPDGSWIDNVQFDQLTQKLSRFSLHTSDGKHRNVIISGDFIQFELADKTRLVFHEGRLVALAGSQGIVPLYDLDGLGDFEYVRDPSDQTGTTPASPEVAASSWQHQTYQDTQAIRFVERDYANEQWVVNIDLRTNSPNYSKGEMFLDLRYDIPGLAWQAPIDMRGKKISFLFKLDPGFQQNPNYLSNIQVFAKDKDWNTQYGTKVSMTASSGWIEVSLIPTEGSINTGYTDPGFDPSNIAMIGLRITQPDNAPSNLNYLGKIFVKHNILPDLFANVNRETNPLDSLYYDLGITRDTDLAGGGTGQESDQETLLNAFAQWLAAGPSDSVTESILNQINWNVEREAPQIKGISSFYKDSATGEIVMNANLVSNSTTGLKEGQIFFDLTKDVPALGWGSSLNFTSRPIKMLIKVPPGMIGSSSAPNGARIFVKDVDNGYQYGTWVNLNEADKWYEIELTPTFGSVPMGVTSPGFDPSKIVKIGINVATQAGSMTNFSGQIQAKFMPRAGSGDTGTTISMPLWMDLRNIKEYLKDQNGNYIRVPRVNSLSSSYFNYVFNEGSGTPPTANFAALEMSNTVWQSQNWGGGSRASDVSWNGAGDTLIYNLQSTSKEFMLDMGWNCYVPGMNWQNGSSIDMTTQSITFYVRPQNANGARFSIEAFAKDSYWWTELSETVTTDGSGAWTKVTLTPLPVVFNSGYYDADFNPRALRAIGLRIQAVSGTYTGPIEIKYDVSAVDLGLADLGDTGTLPQNPVWVNQRELGQYLIDNGIALDCDHGIISEVNQLISQIPEHRLPSDLAAFTVYDEDFNAVSITKPNGTTTYFNDDSKIDYISFADGSVFVDYAYDSSGGLLSATLVDARERLDKAFSGAIADIDKKTADTLMVLAEKKALITENFMIGVNAARASFASQRAALEAQRYVEIEHRFLWWTWTERIEVQGISEAIAQVNAAEATYNAGVAEQLASLDASVQAKKDEIQSERDKVAASYEWQKSKVLVGIARQELFPIIHYYYKSILGREVTEDELAAAFRRVDGNMSFAGIVAGDITDAAGLALCLKAMAASPIYAQLSTELKEFISGFAQGGAVDDKKKDLLAKDLDAALQDIGLYAKLVTYYGSQAGLDALLSQATRQFRDGLACLSVPPAQLTAGQKNDIYWLNRYIAQDICAGIAKKDRSAPVLNAAALKIELASSSEHALSEGFKSEVIDYIEVFFARYADPQEDRAALLAALGLTGSEVMDITDVFLQMLYGWLDGQDLHFGKSAFGSLEKMLIDNGISGANMRDIAKKALLIDILLGITGPLSDEKIAISMFTMKKVAALYGLACENVRLNYSDIVGVTKPFVTLINGYHYVTVTSVTQDEVRYWDSNIGASGGEVTLCKKDFVDNWQGNVITAQNADGKERILDAAAKKIKGAFFWFIPAIIIFCVQAVTAIVSAAIAVAAAVIVPLITLISNVAVALVSAVAGIGNLLAFAGNAFLGALGMGGGAAAAGTAAAGTTGSFISTLATSAIPTVIKVGVAYGTSVGLEALGVDPAVTSILSALVTGGVDGFLSNTGAIGIFRSAIQYGTTAGMGLIGQYFDFDPVITDIMSMATSAFVGSIGLPSEQFSRAVRLIATNVAGELAYYGVQQFGSYLGIDPRVSYLAGVGIRSSLQAGLSSNTGPAEMWNSVTTGLLQGVTNIGLNYLTQEMGINPLLANIGFSAISGVINAGIQAITGGNKNIFQTIFKTYADNVLAFFGNGDPNDAWKRAAYISQILDFSDIIIQGGENGLEIALNTYGAGFFNAMAVNNIIQSGYTIGGYFASKLAAGHYTDRTLQDGTEVKEVTVPGGDEPIANAFFQQRQVGEDTYWDLIGYEEFIAGDSYLGWGDFGVDAYGKLGYTDAEIYAMFDSDIQFQRITDGQQAYAEIKDWDGNTLLIIEPTAGGSHNVYDSYGEYQQAKMLSIITDMTLDIIDGTPDNVTIGQGAGATTLSISGQDLGSLLFSTVEEGKIVIDKLIKQSTWQGLVGIAEAAENITSPLTGIANLAINKINSGEAVDLTSIASASVWQNIFVTAGSMSDWASTVSLLFANSISPVLAPGTEMLMNLFGSDIFREQLQNQAAETFNGYNLFEELASAALGNPGAGTIIEQIGARNFWEGIKSTAELVWNNRNSIFGSVQDLAELTLNPSAYVGDLVSDIGQQFMIGRDEFFCLKPPDTYISPIDPITKTLRVDPDLNYFNIMQQPVTGIMDLCTLVRFGNLRWDRASADAGAKSSNLQNSFLSGALRGISYSGINDTGIRLDTLTKLLSPYAIGSFVITHSAGISSFLRSGLRPDMAIITSPQEKRADVENWIDQMGYTPNKVLVVDTAGDLPYRPIDLIDLSIQDIITNITNPANLLVTDISNLINNNAYHDYSTNPSKYTYMRIISGPGIDRDIDIVENHMVAFEGALDPNAKYDVSINGVLWKDVRLKDMYDKFLKGEL